MPVKSLNSAVRKWPDRDKVVKEARWWAENLARKDKSVENVYMFGSAAGRQWGVGSDIDIVVELKESKIPFIRRSVALNPSNVSVPAEILIYTRKELKRMRKENRRFIREFDKNSRRIYSRNSQQEKKEGR